MKVKLTKEIYDSLMPKRGAFVEWIERDVARAQRQSRAATNRQLYPEGFTMNEDLQADIDELVGERLGLLTHRREIEEQIQELHRKETEVHNALQQNEGNLSSLIDQLGFEPRQ